MRGNPPAATNQTRVGPATKAHRYGTQISDVEFGERLAAHPRCLRRVIGFIHGRVGGANREHFEQSLADAEAALDADVNSSEPGPQATEAVVPTEPTSPTSTATPTTATPPTTTTSLPYVLPAGGDLTERQTEMLVVLGKYLEAIQANDGDGATAFVTPDGYLEYPELDQTFSVSDGGLQDHFRTVPEYSALHPLEPKMVAGDRVIISGTVDNTDGKWLSIIRFTPDGPVLVMSESVYL